MRPLVALCIYFLTVFIGGALLAPWIFKLAQASAHLAPDIKTEFHFYVQNSLLAVALIGAWPLLRSQGATSFRDVGLVSPLREWRKLAGGFLLGFISLALVAAVALLAGVRGFRSNLEFWHMVEKLIGILLTAFGVALLEEILFRGAVFGSLRKVFHWGFALILSSGIYAIMHFLADGQQEGDVTWLSGLQLLPQMLSGFVDFHDLVPAFFNLTLAGTLLGFAYQRTGNLWFSIGVHAGWIFWVKCYSAFTKSVRSDYNWFFGTNKMVNGWIAFIVLALALIVFTRLPVAREKNQIVR